MVGQLFLSGKIHLQQMTLALHRDYNTVIGQIMGNDMRVIFGHDPSPMSLGDSVILQISAGTFVGFFM